ncbi:MAG: hypothetical protein ACLSHR_01190 [Oscillospiraceae bacterium]
MRKLYRLLQEGFCFPQKERLTDHRIKTFAVLCDCMNYRIAAERLHLTQPAVRIAII